MYKEYYGFTVYPFSPSPDPQFLYPSKKHENCLRYLLYSLEQEHGLTVLTGEAGTGKTLLLNILMKSLDEKTHKVFLAHSRLEFLDVLRYISHALGVQGSGISKGELLINLENFLLICDKRTEKVVIMLDEAQNLSVDVLEEVRLLTNFEHHGRKLLQIILIGQPQLESVLQSPQLIQLTQRVGFNCQLLPLNYPETKCYIERRLAVAGSVHPLFTAQAIKQIFVCSKGIPQAINLISDTALLFGFREETRTIGRTIIRQVIQELDLYSTKKSISTAIIHKRDDHGPHASGITAHQDTLPSEGSVPSRGPHLKIQLPFRTKLLHAIPTDDVVRAERMLHDVFDDCRLVPESAVIDDRGQNRGGVGYRPITAIGMEWFRLSVQAIEWIKMIRHMFLPEDVPHVGEEWNPTTIPEPSLEGSDPWVYRIGHYGLRDWKRRRIELLDEYDVDKFWCQFVSPPPKQQTEQTPPVTNDDKDD